MFEFNIQTANVHNIPIVLTVEDMAEILRVKEVVIEELVRDGKIKAVKDITEIRVPSIFFPKFSLRPDNGVSRTENERA